MNKQIVNLILLASTLQILESYFPHPVPGVRLGLANFVSLLVILKTGLDDAIKVVIFRTICSSIFLGTFLSVSFILSFVSGIVSTIAMWAIYKIFSQNKIFNLSPLGISVSGAIAHNLSQLTTVYLLFIRQKEIFYFLPILIFSAVLTGSITGTVTLYVLKEFSKNNYVEEQPKICSVEEDRHTFNSFTWYSNKMISISIMFVLCLFLFAWNVLKVQILATISMLVLYFITRSQYRIFLSNLGKVKWLIFTSVLVPLVFSRTGRVIFSIKDFPLLTTDSLNLGLSYTLRIVAITIMSSFFIQKFTLQEISFILSKLLFFYPDAGRIIAEVLIKFPEFVENIKKKFELKSLLQYKNIKVALGQRLAELVMGTIY